VRSAWWRGKPQRCVHAMQTDTRTLKRARALRKSMSLPEVLLWNGLRGRAQGKPVFRRQHAIGPYVLDFYCAKAKLCIEIDGRSHELRTDADVRRDRWLATQGIEVVRYPAPFVLAGPEAVVDDIYQIAARRLANPKRPAVY
jgi:very-short-patch-repair endonuclease